MPLATWASLSSQPYYSLWHLPIPVLQPWMALYPAVPRSSVLTYIRCDALCILWNKQLHLLLSLTDQGIGKHSATVSLPQASLLWAQWLLQPARVSAEPFPESSSPITRIGSPCVIYNTQAFTVSPQLTDVLYHFTIVTSNYKSSSREKNKNLRNLNRILVLH